MTPNFINLDYSSHINYNIMNYINAIWDKLALYLVQI